MASMNSQEVITSGGTLENEGMPPAVVDELRLIFPPSPKDAFVKVGRCGSTGKDIHLCYSAFGDPSDPCILLIMGMNATSVMWDSRLCLYLAEAGFYVIRYDNRDVGLSTHFDEYRSPFIFRLALPAWVSIGESPVPYTLEDMADDAAGLLKALKIGKAHIVGCSMGGMIAQLVMLRHPGMVASMCLLSTSAGVPSPKLSLLLTLLDKPENPKDVHSVVDYRVRFFRAIAGDMSFDEHEFRLGMWYDFTRASYLTGARRHLAAIARAADRSAALKANVNRGSDTLRGGGSSSGASHSIASAGTCGAARSGYFPVVVLHGGKDPLIPLSEGQYLANCIEGARLVVFPKMGHYFSKLLFKHIGDEIILNARAAPQ